MISLIAAMATNRTIGKNNNIPWKIPGEQQRFRTLTWGKTVIMGRKTFESIGKPLRGRQTIIISRNEAYTRMSQECLIAHSLDSALDLCRGQNEVFIAGGQQLYELALPIASSIYLTVIDKEFDGDTFFPQFSLDQFTEVSAERVEGDVPYTYFRYARQG